MPMEHTVYPEDPPPVPYLHSPDVSPDGQTVAFVYAGNIWFVPLAGGEARLMVSHPAYNDRPRFSPEVNPADGKSRWLAFQSRRTGNGDIYLLALDSGKLHRLIRSDGPNQLEDWSPDGEWLYFSSEHGELGKAVYKVARRGGTAIRLFGDAFEECYNLAVSPQGDALAFNNNGDWWWRHGPNPGGASQIWTVSTFPGADDFRMLPCPACGNLWPMWSPGGDGLYFVSDRGGCENLWYQPRDGGPARPVTDFKDGRVLRPRIARAAGRIVFERDFEIWQLDLSTCEAVPIPIQVQADQYPYPVRRQYVTNDVDEFALSPDGRKIVFVVSGRVFADFADKSEKPHNDAFVVDARICRNGQVHWDPESRKVVYVSDASGDSELMLYDFASRQRLRLTHSGGSKYGPQFSPDGKMIAFLQHPDEIRLLDLDSGENRPLVRALFDIVSQEVTLFAWSPDSRWLAFVALDTNYFSNVYVQRVDETTARPLTFLSNLSAGAVHWAPDGSFLVYRTGQHRFEYQIVRVDLQPVRPKFREEEFHRLFQEEETRKSRTVPKAAEARTTARGAKDGARELAEPVSEAEAEAEAGTTAHDNEEEREVEIDFEDLKHRLRVLTPYHLSATPMRLSPDGKSLIFRGTSNGKVNLWSLPLEEERREEAPRQLTNTSGWKDDVFFTPDGKKIYYVDDGEVSYREFPKGDAQSLETTAEFEAAFHLEKRQVFIEAWRLLRDHFYDPGFHGRDWQALRQQYFPLALGAQTREELRQVINLMVGELNASHVGAFGGAGDSHDGYLGVAFDRREQEATGRLRVSGVVPLGPAALAEPPVREGDYLLEVEGVTLGGEQDLFALLYGKAGRRLVMRINDTPELEGAREVVVRPLEAGEMFLLRYREWVRRNAELVARASAGRLGYVHIRRMDYEALQQFLADLDTETYGKSGVVIDVRFNSGGYTATFILDVLHRRGMTYSSLRGAARTSSIHISGNRVLEKPTVVVINEHSGSNTEMFAEGYRQLGLGKVVGKPSAGAVIWTTSRHLLDGTLLRLPRIQVTTATGENLEGVRREVDAEVDQPLGAWARGHDHQLEKAVEVLLAQIG